MKKFNLTNFIKGWFCGSFYPTIFDTKEYEVGIKRYKAGDYEPSHFHLLADEITIIILGEVEMNGVKYSENDIILIEKGMATDFKCLTDVVTCVVKSGSFAGDKYIK